MFKKLKNIFLQLITSFRKPRITTSSYYPISDIKNKNNYKRYLRIERNGHVTEKILLDLPTQKQREEIVFKHFLKFLGGDIRQKDTCYEIIYRDNPWDFSVQSDFHEKFHVEITSIADNNWSFEKTKREEEYKIFILKDKIPLRKLKKFALWFGTQDVLSAVSSAIKNNSADNDLITNPIFKKTSLFISDTKDEPNTLHQLVSMAIEKKVEKPHNEKEKVIIIIDNRTTRFGIEDYFKMMNTFDRNKTHYPFKEIFFYTGYYSDNDGNNSEFSFSEIQLSEETRKLLNERINKKDIQLKQNGIYYR